VFIGKLSRQLTTTQLPNGLTILLKEIHTVPLISHWVWYRVGSRYESAGQTGISHFVEHIQFKGTSRFPIKILDHAISRDGGVWNALTHLDWTAYFETMPANKIDLALELEADRMVNSRFDQPDIESERGVIMAEREGHENEPQYQLNEAVLNAAFEQHPYKHEVIGEMEDIKRISRDELFTHYRRYYHPGNAVIAVAGDFQTSEMVNHLTQLYGELTTPEMDQVVILPEASIGSERDVLVQGSGETTYMQVAYRAPAGRERDFFILNLLDSLLTGPSSLNMFGGGGVGNKTSRLYQSLVEKDLAISVGGGLQATMDPFLFEISITLHPEHTTAEVVNAIDAEISRLQDHLVQEQEIQRALKQAKAMFAYSSENITNQAFWMGYTAMFAEYQWFENYIANLESISVQDIQNVARKYLNPENRVVGVFKPNHAGRT
jgi:zinc protease